MINYWLMAYYDYIDYITMFSMPWANLMPICFTNWGHRHPTQALQRQQPARRTVRGSRGWRLGGEKLPGPVIQQFAKLKMAIEIVDLSIKNGDFP